MGYVFDFQDAQAWRTWLEKPAVARAVGLQTRLMCDMLGPRRLDTVVSIGCGTGHHLGRLVEQGLDVTGIDPSPYMLDIARERFGHRVALRRGVAERLPFDDNAFNHGVLFLSLEYVDDPVKALAEAFRVAKDRVFIGAWNRTSLHRLWRQAARLYGPSIFDRARCHSLWQIRRHIHDLMGDVPVAWRTVGQLSLNPSDYALWFESRRFMQHCPFGAFLAVVVTLAPRFRVRPLELTCPAGQRPVAG